MSMRTHHTYPSFPPPRPAPAQSYARKLSREQNAAFDGPAQLQLRSPREIRLRVRPLKALEGENQAD
ncbi:MAG TPA: hypothetical protein VG275_06015, partial [Solirubrobacteraceae bacterium]|nr:hypothetical protein [Solirubrobacteraceae bacterium]